jgi:glycine hydroxymethyltransferase
MDVVAGLMHEVLSSTRPGTTKAGTPSKASYELDSAVSGRVSKEASDLLAGFPLYPEVDLG